MSEHESEMTWELAETPSDRFALIFRGVQVAAINEIGRLYDEGLPIPIWQDGKVVDATGEMHHRETGRSYFLIGLALLGAIPVLGGIFYFAAKSIFAGFMPYVVLMFGVLCLGTFGLGAWYGNKPTRRNCLVIMLLLLPVLIYLIYWWFSGGFQFGF